MSDLQIQGQIATQNAKTAGKATKPAPQESVGKAYAKGLWEGFKGYYAEQYEGTKGVGDALVRTGKMLNDAPSTAGLYKIATTAKAKDQTVFKSLGTAAKAITVGAGYGLYKIATAKTEE